MTAQVAALTADVWHGLLASAAVALAVFVWGFSGHIMGARRAR